MFLKENIILAVSGLKSNKVRAFLTMLGIIIGIGSVIAIVSIGDAVTANVSDTMAGLGANNIYVYVTPRESDYGQTANSDQIDDSDLLTMDQIKRVQKKFSDDISAIAMYESMGSGKARDGHLYANVSINGANPGYGDVENVEMQKGRFLQDRDIAGNRRVAVVSDKLVSNMFGEGTDPLGQKIDVDTQNGVESFTIVGVYKYTQQAMMGMGGATGKDLRTTMYVPVSVVKETSDNQNYTNFEIKLKDVDDAHSFTAKLENYMDQLYVHNTNYSCEVQNLENMMSSVTSMMDTISLAVAAIAAIALIVGGIGVMNIMLVSVTERTREIGTRKALGARSGYIRTQFIVESVIICVIGGIIGIITGIGLAAAGVSLLKMKLVISVPVIFISVGFSMLIGVFFGYYPAKKASQLDPIDALRYE